MSLGNVIAILISLVSLYMTYAFVRTVILKQPVWPLNRIKLD